MTLVRFTSICLLLICCIACGPPVVAPLQVLGQWHKVQKGETIDSIAKKYDADPDVVSELNDIQKNQAITRDEIFVPVKDGHPPGTGEPPAPPSNTDKVAESENPDAVVEGKCGVENRPCFAWPVDGKFSSGFGKRDKSHHDGIDIAAPKGTPIVAAEAGVVLYSGDAIKGYGNLILIRHETGIITVYAHNDKNTVAEGDQVKRGQKIAEVGRTGTATADHVHFEVRLEERPRDPLLYLPTRKK